MKLILKTNMSVSLRFLLANKCTKIKRRHRFPLLHTKYEVKYTYTQAHKHSYKELLLFSLKEHAAHFFLLGK